MRPNQSVQEISCSLPRSLEMRDVKMAVMLIVPSFTHVSLHPMMQPNRERKNFAKKDKHIYSVCMCTRSYIHVLLRCLSLVQIFLIYVLNYIISDFICI